MMRKIDAVERRARLGRRHRLAAAHRAGSPEEVAESLVALHASDPATVYLSAAVRLHEPGTAEMDRALYDKGSLIRLLAMRRTVFVVTDALAPVVHAAASRAVADRERRELLKFLAQGGGWDERWLSAVEDGVLAALAEHGEVTAARLGDHEPRLREQVVVARGKPYEQRQNVSSRIIRVLAAEGRIRRGRPVGSWISGQFRWALSRPLPDLALAEAKAALVRCWLAAYGPGTEADLKWWTGWTLTDVRKALAATGAEQVTLAEGTGHVLPGDAERVESGAPWAALLPALDPTAMGWQQRDWYLPEQHRTALFDRSGNVGPTVWWDGRIIGGWAQRPGGEIVWRLLTDPGQEALAAVENETARLSGWLRGGDRGGGVRITPRFRTPLERELSA